MRKSPFSEEQVLAALTEMAGGSSAREISISLGVSEATVYRWRATYDGLDAKGVAKLRELERENSRLTRINHLQTLHINILKAERPAEHSA